MMFKALVLHEKPKKPTVNVVLAMGACGASRYPQAFLGQSDLVSVGPRVH